MRIGQDEDSEASTEGAQAQEQEDSLMDLIAGVSQAETKAKPKAKK